MNMYALFYAINGVGLGHITRQLAIARKMKMISPNITPLFFTTSEASNILYQHRIPYFKVPSKEIAEDCGLDKGSLGQFSFDVISNIIKIYKPKIFIVDTLIDGNFKELEQILTTPFDMKKVYIHRERKSEKMDENTFNLQKYFDLVIAPHETGRANIPVPPEKEIFWSGTILVRDKEELLGKSNVLDMFNLPTEKKIIYVNFGGGGDATTEQNFKQVINTLSCRGDIHIVLTQAPLSKFKHDNIRNCTVINWYPVIELMNLFDAAISATGYNTFHELLYSGVPSIFIPKKREYDDQEKRAKSVETFKAGFCILEEEINDNLNSRLDKLLENRAEFSSAAQKMVPSNGATSAAKKILSLIMEVV